MRITAVAATMLDGFEPRSWTRLPGSDAERILVSDDERSLIVAVHTQDRAAAAQAEHMAAAALAPLLHDDAPALPRILASRTVDGATVGQDADVTLSIAEPMPGLPLSTAMFEEHPQLVESLARAVAAIHAADPGPIADAGLMVEESAETRERLLADLDTAAATGRVPARLLSRWEIALEEVSAWRFLPVPIHANLGPDALWAMDGDIVAVSDLARLRVGDPAADLAAVSSMLSPEDFERFFRAYRTHRDPGDPGLRRRVGFHAEITVLEWLLAAVAAQDDDAIEDAAHLLEALAGVTEDDAEAPLAFDHDSPQLSEPAEAEDHQEAAVSAEPDESPSTVELLPDAEGSAAEESGTAPEPAEHSSATSSFRPQAPLGDGPDEDGIATERLDTSELHAPSPTADPEP